MKLDGFRAIGHQSGRNTQLWSRNQKDFSRRFPIVASALLKLPSDTVIDGEVVALDQAGMPAFNLLAGLGTVHVQHVCVECGASVPAKYGRLGPCESCAEMARHRTARAKRG